MPKLRRLLAAVPAAAALAILSPVIANAGTATMSIEPVGHVVARVQVVVTVDLTCDLTGQFFSTSGIDVQQASGRSFAHAAGAWGVDSCTGSPQQVPIALNADPSGVPFHGGPAVVNVNFYGFDNFGNFESTSASGGVMLRG